MELKPHQARVVDERTELAAKLFRLNNFIGGAVFMGLDPAEKDRLIRQSTAMATYCHILQERIEAF